MEARVLTATVAGERRAFPIGSTAWRLDLQDVGAKIREHLAAQHARLVGQLEESVATQHGELVPHSFIPRAPPQR